MLRRKPTRLELKLDDTEEFECVKKELEVSSHSIMDKCIICRYKGIIKRLCVVDGLPATRFLNSSLTLRNA